MTKFNVEHITTENMLNRIARVHKISKTPGYILYYSLWDEASDRLRQTIEATNPIGEQGNIPLYLVNTFDNPHATVIYNDRSGDPISMVPCLITFSKGSVLVEDYLPNIYKYLGL